jgi:hypothetical protein
VLPAGADPDIGAAIALLAGTLALGFRHGFDWDHIAAIADITSAARTGDRGQASPEQSSPAAAAADVGSGPLDIAVSDPLEAGPTERSRSRAFVLGTMYALGHASVVAILGLAAYVFGVRLPEWVDPIMGAFVGVTLLILGAWLLLSTFRFARHGHELRLRSRWMLVLDGLRLARDRLRARMGAPMPAAREARPYGAGTSYGVGMIHGIGAETATQILLITALGGVAGQQLGLPLMASFILGLLAGNTVIVGLSVTGFGATGTRRHTRLLVGTFAGVTSIVIGALFVFGWDAALPDLASLLGGTIGA